MTKITNHECPNCGTGMGRVVDNATGRPPVDGVPKEYSHTCCVACGGFLKILDVKDGKITVRMLTEDEILALPDNERLGLTRLSNITRKSGLSPEKIKELVEISAKLHRIWESCSDELTQIVENFVKEKFGEPMGLAILIKHPHERGFQSCATNMTDYLLQDTMRKELMKVNGEGMKLINNIIAGIKVR